MIRDKSTESTGKAQQTPAITRRQFLVASQMAAAIGLAGCQPGESQSAQSTIGQTGTEGGLHGVYPGQTPQTARVSQGQKLRDLLSREGVVLPVLGVPDAIGATKMEAAGCECAFIGTGLVFRRFAALPDEGLVTATEALWMAKYMAESVFFPLILDGDTGHGGPPAVRRFVQDCIKIGLAGVRIDDQAIEAKRSTGSSGIVVVSREDAVERYSAAVEARNELDPSFVIQAQCYAREATNGGMNELLTRIPLYENETGVDWVQFTRPQSVDEIRRARDAAQGTFSAMRGDLPQQLSIAEHADLGLNAAWLTGWPGVVQTRALGEVTDRFKAEGGISYALRRMNT